MLSKNTLFEFLYQNLHDQITCGHLKPGDTLPSMPQLAAIYNVGIRTVKDVLARLKTEGLIQTTERKPARVIYRAEKNSASQSYAVGPVSYTHLDVYKRQAHRRSHHRRLR